MSCGGMSCVWRERKAELHPKNTTATVVKHGCGKITLGTAFLERGQDDRSALRKG